MRHHEHYLGWTIEWVGISSYQTDFWICTQYMDIETESIKTARYAVDVLSIETCKDLIKKILLEEPNAARKIIASYHYDVVDSMPKPTDIRSKDDEIEDEGIDIYLA